ncbi:uncharacterized protein LOC108907362 [Anoplophora glabripennis]|uniref:uncharacterized protein LOC108907362 n=1 Tax=Anoplophora glabripennis TaxID=217634 RepID=UPI0008757766|nr:uncharacterized protein LOC108907362 [Anoplophora glabripennis]
MGGCRCSYKNCTNTTKTTENVHFFHYPVKHKERCKVWIENANKPQFCDLEEDQLRNKVICEVHFEDKWFPNCQKKRLLQGAIPTLDGDCKTEPISEPSETPLYLSSHLQDVQVLPANADGTIFVLDTDAIFNRSQKIESYLYKNGDIVPTNSKPSKQIVTSKPSTSTENNAIFSTFKNEILPNSSRTFDERTNEGVDAHDFRTVVKKEVPEYHENVLNKTLMHQISPQNMVHEIETMQYEHQRQDLVYEESDTDNHQKRSVSRSVNTKNIPKSVIEKSVSRNYLRKIKQHSRDIASIKRMLKQKAFMDTKPDVNILLNSMKEQLPPTFFTILNLNLNNKYDLTDDDIDFFTTIHKTSPQLYQMLIEKYNWNLPCVDIVEETTME